MIRGGSVCATGWMRTTDGETRDRDTHPERERPGVRNETADIRER